MTQSIPACLRPDGSATAGELPPPTPEMVAVGEALAGHLREAIAAAGGAMDFADYMQRVLYTPGLGYYAGGLRKFGAEGDFVTAPEISPLFGRALARQVAEVLEAVGDGAEVLEFGGGSGALAAEVLLELERLGRLPRRYRLLEVSAELRQRQRERIDARAPHLAGRVEWLDALPGGFCGVVLANEVLDAMPVRRFRVTEAGPRPLGVAWEDGRLMEVEMAAEAALSERVAAIEAAYGLRLEPGFTSEYNPALEAWVAALGEALEAGAAFLVDYGYPGHEYYAPARAAGTLICHYRHRAHGDPLVYPGLQDITANVDFTAVARAAVDAGLDVLGFTAQAHFLLGCGLASVAEAAMAGADTREQFELARQMKLLTMPDEMGERFKVIGLGRGLDIPPAGFALRDQRGRL